jgi:hypothetical protein
MIVCWINFEKLRVVVVWIMTPVINWYYHCGGTCCLHLQGRRISPKGAGFSCNHWYRLYGTRAHDCFLRFRCHFAAALTHALVVTYFSHDTCPSWCRTLFEALCQLCKFHAVYFLFSRPSARKHFFMSIDVYVYSVGAGTRTHIHKHLPSKYGDPGNELFRNELGACSREIFSQCQKTSAEQFRFCVTKCKWNAFRISVAVQ